MSSEFKDFNNANLGHDPETWERYLNGQTDNLEGRLDDLELVDGITQSDSANYTDSLRQYLSELRHHPLLTGEQEIDLAKRMHEGRVARARILQGEGLSP